MNQVIVAIDDGKLKGTVRDNYNGEQIYAFLGIPYAKPPVGELRFKAPLPAEPWDGVRDATEDGSMCYQKEMVMTTYKGSEDCLFLNVFTKNISDNQPLKPVLVFIHGGAFVQGSNDSKILSPTLLLMEDIVFVTINYRLGILGFLKLNDPVLGVPGNAGLKDQLLALQWIQKNIRKFGGDPNNVTIWGESAGSASVNYHVISPASKGLFHKAIMQSGTVLNPWAELRSNCLEVMKFLKPDCKDEGEILETLMNIPVQELVEAQNKIAEEWIDNRVRSFAPCVEAPNETAFLTRDPIDIITSGDYNKVAMIIGYNSNEGLMFMIDPFKPPNKSNSPNIDYEYYIPHQMNLAPGSDLKKEIGAKMRKVYSDDRSNDKFLLSGDAYFVAGIIGLVENFARTCPEPIYLHRLNLCTSRNIGKLFLRTQEPGVCHGDDMGYFFIAETPFMPSLPIEPGSIEDKAIRRYIKLWGNFLKYGNPTPDEKEFGLVWEPVTKDNLYYLDVDEDLTIKTNPDAERMEIWREIYKSHENTRNFMV